MILPPNPLRDYRSIKRFTPLKLPINKVFNTIEDQPWVRRPRPILHNPLLPGSEEYCSYYDCKRYQIVYYWALQRYMNELIQQGLLKEYILTPEAAFGQLNTQPFLGATIDRPIQGDRLTIQVLDYRAYFLSFLILCTLLLNKILFYAPNNCGTSIHGSTTKHQLFLSFLSLFSPSDEVEERHCNPPKQEIWGQEIL